MSTLSHELGELALGSRLRQLSDRLMQDVAAIYKYYHVEFEPRWFLLFYQLTITPRMAIVDLASRIGLTHAAVNQIAAAMEKAGLVRSGADPSDRRRRMLSLTTKGKRLLEVILPVWKDIEETNRELIRQADIDLLNALDQYENALSQESFADRVLKKLKQRQIEAVEIKRFTPSWARFFKKLNEEWLRKYFSIEPHDRELLSDPERFVIRTGGMIFFALLEGQVVGTCAVIRHTDAIFELGKMAVTEKAQGFQIGKKLGLAAIEYARSRQATILYLETNRRLKPALNLYQKLGFDFVPFVQTDYARSNVRMELQLIRPRIPSESHPEAGGTAHSD